MVWAIIGGVAVIIILFFVFGGGGVNRGRGRLDLYVADLPLEQMTALHDHTSLLLEVEVGISNPAWKSIEAFTEIMTALRRGIALKTDPNSFTLQHKNRYRRDLGVAVVKLKGKRWKSEYEKHTGERAALQPFEVPANIPRGEYSEAALVEKIEEMGALV